MLLIGKSKVLVHFWKRGLAYRANFFVNIVFGILPLLIQIFLWRTIYSQNSVTEISGLEYKQMITYYLLAFIISGITNPRQIAREIGNEIRSGTINKHILTPYSYFRLKLYDLVALKSVYAISLLVPVIIFVFLFRRLIYVQNIFHFLVSSLLAFYIQYVIYFLLGISVFWSGDNSNMLDFWAQISELMAGKWFPLSMFPLPIEKVLSYLPFYYVLYAPIEIGLNSAGKATLDIVWIQLFWAVMLTIISRIVWKKGLKKYTAYGV